MIYLSGLIKTPVDPLGAHIFTKNAFEGIISIALLAATFAKTVGNNRSGDTEVAAFGSVFISKKSSQLVNTKNNAVERINVFKIFIIFIYLY
jgi:hypothetical protein